VNVKLPMTNFECRISGENSNGKVFPIRHSPFAVRNFIGFTLVEVMVVVALLSLIVLALMAVFDSTQKAFRASITQTDILEGGRAAMDLIASDVRLAAGARDGSGMNFYVNTMTNFNNYQPMIQGFPVDTQHSLTNVLENFFILHRENQTWTGIGYAVAPTNLTGPFTGDLYSLYRFSMSTNISGSPLALFRQFTNDVYSNSWSNGHWSHLMNGVVHLTVRGYDNRGVWLTNGFGTMTNLIVRETRFYPPAWSEVGFYMTNTALPATAEIQMNVLEDNILRHAESLTVPGETPWDNPIQWTYLTNAIGQVHVFRQRVVVQNVDPSVYQ